MGLFNRKNTKLSDTASNGTNNSNNSLKSPTIQKPANGLIFNSPSMPDITLPSPPDPTLDPAAYLRSIYAVRARSKIIFEHARRNRLAHFNVDVAKFKDTADYVVSIIKVQTRGECLMQHPGLTGVPVPQRDYAPDYHKIPPHGRWQHFDAGGRPRVDQLLASWPSSVDNQERTRRLLDLFLVSVLLDAGAGTRWSYKSKESGKVYRRSEGLAVASLEMFKAGYFSSEQLEPCQVDSAGLERLSIQQLAKGLQVSETNPISGLEGRAGLLSRLGDALKNTTLFGKDGRPGNMLDYLLSHPSTHAASVPIVTLPTLWSVLINGLASIWPESRTRINGVPLGDAWPCSSMPESPPAQPWENVVPFHKLTQWLCYSLMVPMTKLLHIQFAGADLLTGLPEYRNGGLLIDTGLLTLKAQDSERGLANFRNNAMQKGQPSMEVVPLFSTDDDVIVEWRAVTVGFLDELLIEVNRSLGLQGPDRLTLAQMLEAGTWKVSLQLKQY